MTNYATVEDMAALYSLTSEELERAAQLIPIVSASLRTEARKRSRDLDAMLASDPDLRAVATSVTCDIVNRQIEQQSSLGASTLTQESQSALGYSWSGTYTNTGGGLAVLNKDLKRLGLTRPRYGAWDALEGGHA